MKFALSKFVEESNRIEGMHEVTAKELNAHTVLLACETIQLLNMIQFVSEIADADLRSKPGLDVRVGEYFPPRGGPEIVAKLKTLLQQAPIISAYEAHLAYETLHPFMDGNGRSGRALWLWCMKNNNQPIYNSSFLHTWYYQSLSGARKK